MNPGDRIDPQPVTLDVRPVSLSSEPDRDRALAAANGVDLVQERVTQIARLAAIVIALLFIVRCILGCAALDRAVPAIGVAHDVAKAGCAILAATDGSSADVLAATEAMRREILEAQADAAKARGANAETIDALVRSIALLSATVREQAGQVVTAAGNGPARLPPCPAPGSEPAKQADPVPSASSPAPGPSPQ